MAVTITTTTNRNTMKTKCTITADTVAILLRLLPKLPQQSNRQPILPITTTIYHHWDTDGIHVHVLLSPSSPPLVTQTINTGIANTLLRLCQKRGFSSSKRRFDWLIDWLIEWLIDWLQTTITAITNTSITTASSSPLMPSSIESGTADVILCHRLP